MKLLIPLLPTLAVAWDARKFLEHVDSTNSTRQAQDQAQHRQESSRGSLPFDPHALSRILHSPIFWHYVNMALMIEAVPPELASFGECCPCHLPLLGRLSEHRKRRMMAAHFGDGATTCPAAGMMAPEIIAGKLAEIADRAWEDLTAKLLCLEALPGDQAMSEKDRSLLMQDLNKCQSVLKSLLA